MVKKLRKVILFIAMSLDGYIADSNGETKWLEGQTPGKNDMISYEAFIRDVDTVIMGANTYRQLVTVLSPDEWIYPNLDSYIITHFPEQSMDKIKFTREEPSQLVKRLIEESGKNIWICGGANIVKQLIRDDAIDQYFINVIPTILGDGIRLFDGLERERKLKLIKTNSYNGITDLVYEQR